MCALANFSNSELGYPSLRQYLRLHPERQLPGRLLQGDERRRVDLCHLNQKHHVVRHWVRDNAVVGQHG